MVNSVPITSTISMDTSLIMDSIPNTIQLQLTNAILMELSITILIMDIAQNIIPFMGTAITITVHLMVFTLHGTIIVVILSTTIVTTI